MNTKDLKIIQGILERHEEALLYLAKAIELGAWTDVKKNVKDLLKK